MQTYFDAAKLPLLAAEFDYFRTPREKWELMLIRLRQMGATIITVTLPWGFHECNQGTVDLNGATNSRRDVHSLMKLCSTLDFQCIFNLGPYTNNGVLGDGLPLWLSRDSDDFETNLTQAVEGWYKAVSKAFTSQQWPDGPIIALQINSEPIETRSTTYSKHLTEVKWRIWLRKRYEGIEALNSVYGTDYRTVNDVKFPRTWEKESSPQAKDAQDFLEKVRIDTQTHHTQILFDAGWELPVYPTVIENNPELPLIESCSLADGVELSTLNLAGKILNLQQPIQIDPDPIEVGQTPTWAGKAPIRADGSLRQSFWTARQALWSHTLAETRLKDNTLTATFATAKLVTRSGNSSLKIDIPAGTKPTVYRLRLSGELLAEDQLKMQRGKLSGPYLAEDEFDQTDLLLILTDPTIPLTNFPLAYLSDLLAAQTQTIIGCVTLAETLGKMLTASPDTPEGASPERPQRTLNTLEEARRGLREADAALRKAITSISGLENGLATILDQSSPATTPRPAQAATSITPELFGGPARDILAEVGTAVTEVVPQLKAAVTGLQNTIDTAAGFTVEQYRQGYAKVVGEVQAARQPLLETITRLRVEIGIQKLPLIAWSVHDQVQEIAETLRWGVLRQ